MSAKERGKFMLRPKSGFKVFTTNPFNLVLATWSSPKLNWKVNLHRAMRSTKHSIFKFEQTLQSVQPARQLDRTAVEC